MLRKRTLTLLMLLMLFFTSARAQESTEEVPPPTNTFVPSETPSLTPTFTETPSLTPSPTSTFTETATYTETPSETPTLSETPTETATATPTPTAESTTEAEITSEVTPEVTAEITATPTSTLEAKVEPTRTAPPPSQILPSGSQMLLSCDPNDLIVVRAGDSPALLAAIAVVNSCPSIHYTVYVQPSEDMIFDMDIVLSSPISISGNVTIYANNAIIRSTYTGSSTSTGYSLITIISGAIVEFHHVIIENGYNWVFGYGGGITNNGLLSIYDSILRYNPADNGGGAILNWGTLRIERTLFQTNAADGGGALRNINTFGGNMTITCSRFTTNGAFFGGAILGEGSFGSLSIVASYNTFDGNNASISDDIHNVAAGPPILAQNNYWGADGVADVNATVDASSPLLSDPIPDPNTGLGGRPECRQELLRLVDSSALPLHIHATEFGLPMPFDIFPYEDTSLTKLSVQGYGPNSWARDNWIGNYSFTYGMHPGLDYGAWNGCDPFDANNWCEERVVSVCDGILVRGRHPNDGYQGASTDIGWGISIRCFDNTRGSSNPSGPLNLLDYDTDGDGNPNLSNIVVVYNHLGQCKTPSGGDGWLYSPKKECPPENRVNTRFDDYYQAIDADGSQLGVVVRKGQFLGTTGRHPYDHLHLEIYLARGYESATSSIVINPILMYSQNLLDQHEAQSHLIRPYYPVKLDWQNRDPIENVWENPNTAPILGIFVGDLDRWSQGGNRNAGTGNSGEIFWKIQTPTPTTIVEWHNDLHPIALAGVINDTFSSSLTTFLGDLYPVGTEYDIRYYLEYGITPNCTIIPDTNPTRLDCPRIDVLSQLS